MSEQQNLTDEKQFLQEIARECYFYGDTLAVFLERFEPSKASLPNEILAQYIKWGKKPVNGRQKIFDELRNNIYPVLKEKGCPLLDKQRGKKPKGYNPTEIVLKWLWGTKFREWKNKETVSDNINWHQICQSRLDAYKEHFLNNPLITGNHPNIYVPLGLVEPQPEQDTPQKEEVKPENGSRFYQLAETEITKTYNKPNQFFEEVLRQGNSKSKGQKIAIIGEPGAGKTTLLYQIAQWILDKELGYPILIRLAGVNKPLLEYLTQDWLCYATNSTGEVSQEWVSAFEQLRRGDKVWLLLDAVDEMGIMSPLADINEQLADELHGLRVVLTCRLNVWEGEKNALRGFDVYRNLDFNSQQIQEFIEQWFNDTSQSQELLKQLNEPNKTRLNDLIKNPLRLALLCRTWKRGQKLPETQAGLYQRLVNSHYQWKDEQKPFQIPDDVQERLHQQLGELAKTGINREQYRFRLEEKFVEKYLGKPQRENSLFYWALKLGWLNRVGLASVEEKDSDQAVYAFFHPTFQEYFAALAINNWDYFLPRNHVNCPVEGKEKEYRIFEPQWKQVILLWLGRDDVDSREKEAFIQRLVSFKTGCYGNFYGYRAYFLAAAGINEFQECSRSDAIVKQIVKLGFGYFDNEHQTWKTFLAPIQEGARMVLPETIREKAIANLIQVFSKTDGETRSRVAESLGEIGVGNEPVIQTLLPSFITTMNEDEATLGSFANSLGKIAVGHEGTIQALIDILRKSKNKDFSMVLSGFLATIAVGHEGAIQALFELAKTTEGQDDSIYFCDAYYKAVGNQGAIQVLTQVLATSEDEYTRSIVASSLENIDPGNKEARQALIQVLITTDDKYNRRHIANVLGEIAVGNKEARQALTQVLGTSEDEYTRSIVASSLENIDPGNKEARQALIQVLITTENKDLRWKIADTLGEIAVGDKEAIRALIQLGRTSEDEETPIIVANNLGYIAVRNGEAIEVLVQILRTSQNEYNRMIVASSLENIDPGNKEAIRELIRILETTKDYQTSLEAVNSLGSIAAKNELVMQELIRVLETTKNEDTRRKVAWVLGIIAVRNKEAIRELIRILETLEDEYTSSTVAESLGKMIKTEKQYTDIIFALNHNLTNEVYNNNCALFKNCYKLLWQCAQNLPYPKFHHAWHKPTPLHPEMTDITPVGNTPTVRQLEKQFPDISTQLSHLPVHCINVNKLLTLNIKNEIVQAFCNRLYQKLLPNETIPKVQTVTDLETEIIHLKQQLQTPHLFILLQGDGTPTPEVIDYCDYLTEELHLGWITPDPLPLPPPQRSFVVSQENLLKAVESWVAEY